MGKIGFVVLHYNTIESTVLTVNSITQALDDYEIVIVDNDSPNGTGKELAQKYFDVKNITVIQLQKNVGFARGNNEGYKYLKSNEDIEFICILNNDVIVLERDLVCKIKAAYNDYSFGVLGPHIILADDSDNKFDDVLHDVSFYENNIVMCENRIASIKNQNRTVLFLKEKCKRLLAPFRTKKRSNTERCRMTYEIKEDVVLHGCCLFFSRLYINQFDDAFYSKTFLYGEEELLYLRCERNGIKTLYYPSILIKHLEDVATNSVSIGVKDKRIRSLEYSIESTKIIIDVINNQEDKVL